MSLICMAVYDTEENGRSEYTEATLRSLSETVDWSRHRLVVIDNGSCERTKKLLRDCVLGVNVVITNETNLGTAKAINMGIKMRRPQEYVIKCDNDVVWHSRGWVDEMEEAIDRSPEIGVLGLKRKDLLQSPYSLEWPSELVQLPHEPGQKWLYVEKAPDIMGTCTMLNWRLLDKVGYYQQPNQYGLDDSWMNHRSIWAGFYNAFLVGVEIDHIDTGDNPYSKEKERIAGEAWPVYHQWYAEYMEGKRSLYYDGGF